MGNLRIVELLQAQGADMNFKDRWGGTALADAVREGHREVANFLIKMGGKLEYDEETAASTLCELAKDSDLDKVKLLLAGGCSTNGCDCAPAVVTKVSTAQECTERPLPPLPAANNQRACLPRALHCRRQAYVFTLGGLYGQSSDRGAAGGVWSQRQLC